MRHRVLEWGDEHLRKLDKRLCLVWNAEDEWWEVWWREHATLPIPRHAEEAVTWQMTPPAGRYMHIMNCIVGDTIADPGPWLLDYLARWDIRRDGEKNLRMLRRQQEEVKQRELTRKREEFDDGVSYNRRAMTRVLNGQSPHGGLHYVSW